MDKEKHIIIKRFLTNYQFTESTTLHSIYSDFEPKEFFPGFRTFCRTIKNMGVSSRSFRRDNKVIRVYFYEPKNDTYLASLHKLNPCPRCKGSGVVRG